MVPALFVVLWSTGFIGARLGLPHAEPLTFLTLRYVAVLALMLPLAFAVRARWPATQTEFRHIATAGILMQGGYLGGVFCAVHAGMSAGVVALIVGMQPLLTAAGAGPLLGERILRIQWLGLAMGLTGVALVVWQKMSLQGMSAGSLALALLALLSMTLGTLYQKRYCPSFDLRTGSGHHAAHRLRAGNHDHGLVRGIRVCTGLAGAGTVGWRHDNTVPPDPTRCGHTGHQSVLPDPGGHCRDGMADVR